jgi:hypothetical protein
MNETKKSAEDLSDEINDTETIKEFLDGVDDIKTIKKIISAAYEKENKLRDLGNEAAKNFVDKTQEGKALVQEAREFYDKRKIVIPVKDLKVVLQVNNNSFEDYTSRLENKEQKLVLSSGEEVSLSDALYTDKVLKLFEKDPNYIETKNDILGKLTSFLEKLQKIAEKENIDYHDLLFYISQKARNEA